MTASPLRLDQLGQRLKAARVAQGWSQKELCAQAGVSPRFLVQLEGGEANVSLRRLADVAVALDCSLVSLLAGLGPEDPVDRVADALRKVDEDTCRHVLLEVEGARTGKIALVGLRGAGKSAVGREAANRLGCPFVELNRLVVERAGMSLAEVFEYHGAGRYHALCADVLESLLLEPGASVIEVGGSLVLDDTAYGLLREHSRVVWLQATPEAHLERVRAQGDTRPMAGRDDALGELRQILQDRSPLYGLAHQQVDTVMEGFEGSIQAVVALASR